MTTRGWVWEPSAVCWQSYVDSPSHFAPLGTLERQSLCESHRQRRWLTYWSHRTPAQHLLSDPLRLASRDPAPLESPRILGAVSAAVSPASRPLASRHPAMLLFELV